MILSLAAHKNCQYYFKPSIKHLWRGADQSEDYCICNDKCPISCNSSLYPTEAGKISFLFFYFPTSLRIAEEHGQTSARGILEYTVVPSNIVLYRAIHCVSHGNHRWSFATKVETHCSAAATPSCFHQPAWTPGSRTAYKQERVIVTLVFCSVR